MSGSRGSIASSSAQRQSIGDIDYCGRCKVSDALKISKKVPLETHLCLVITSKSGSDKTKFIDNAMETFCDAVDSKSFKTDKNKAFLVSVHPNFQSFVEWAENTDINVSLMIFDTYRRISMRRFMKAVQTFWPHLKMPAVKMLDDSGFVMWNMMNKNNVKIVSPKG